MNLFYKRAGEEFFTPQQNPLSTEQIQKFLDIAYSRVPGGPLISASQLKQEADGFYLGVDDVNPDVIHWMRCYKNTPYGKKFFAVGHDGEKSSVKELLNFFSRDKDGEYSEVSGAPEGILERAGVPKVPVETVQKMMPNKKITPIDKFHYKRDIHGVMKEKIMYGRPLVPKFSSELLIAKNPLFNYGDRVELLNGQTGKVVSAVSNFKFVEVQIDFGLDKGKTKKIETFKVKKLSSEVEVLHPQGKRCTQATLEAFKIIGLKPLTNLDVIKALTDHKWKTEMMDEVRGHTVDRFVKEHTKGDYYLATQNHAMALRDGVLTDTTGQGADNRPLLFAVSVTR
jgi:hypothetical protein